MNKPMTEIEMLKAELEALRAQVANKANGKLQFKVGEAGGVVVRFPGYKYPVHMFLAQYDMLKAQWNELEEFVKANRSKFSTKG